MEETKIGGWELRSRGLGVVDVFGGRFDDDGCGCGDEDGDWLLMARGEEAIVWRRCLALSS